MKLVFDNTDDVVMDIPQDKVKQAEGVLLDNGVENPRDVLQAIGYVLLGTELYPFDDDDEQ